MPSCGGGQLMAWSGGQRLGWEADGKGGGGLRSRALGNRGNARTRQGKLDAALGDFNAAIELCPWAVDPVLNRSPTPFLRPPFHNVGPQHRQHRG